jgi:hypothetical protein
MKNKKTLEQLVNEPYCEPTQDPKLGDLTPSYIDWFYNNRSREDFYRKYSGRRNRVEKKYFEKL